MRIDLLDYELPEELIATRPASRREQARLLVRQQATGQLEHRTVADLGEYLQPGDLLVVNDTQVIPARFFAVRRRSGGRVEGLFVEEESSGLWRAMLKSGGCLRAGEWLDLDAQHHLILADMPEPGLWRMEKSGPLGTRPLLEKLGHMPLPPYILKQRQQRGEPDADALDRERYQTVFRSAPGAVAAPTAGLHLTPALLEELQNRAIGVARITLHVGPGTFAPVQAEDLNDHPMHTESFTVPAATLRAMAAVRASGGKIVPVGTTCVRALESLPEKFLTHQDISAQTRLLIQPGFRFRFTDGLMTNFHLPRSTLLALVAARTGLEPLKEMYAEAVRHRYRFYSYGDAMLIL